MKKYIIVTVTKKSTLNNLSTNHGSFLQSVSSTLNQHCDYQISNEGKIKLTLKETQVAYSTLEQANEGMSKHSEDYQWILECDDETQELKAIHESHFTSSATLEMNHLYLQNSGKYDNSPIDRKRFFESIGYGLLKKFAHHNVANKNTYKKGLTLVDLLLKNPPKEAYRITQKPIDLKLAQKKLAESVVQDLVSRFEQQSNFLEKEPKAAQRKQNVDKFVNNLKQTVFSEPQIPQIDFDNFTADEIYEALTKFGSFELVGRTIDNLRAAAQAALLKSKELLAIPEEQRKPFKQEKFNGFQEVLEDSKARAQSGTGVIRNQIAFHFKPYFGKARAPASFDDTAFREYYDQGMAILYTLYRKIMLNFKVDPNRLSGFENDQKSVLTCRRYFASKGEDGARTGIPAHSDYGDLTLVMSDEDGLEVQRKDGTWVSAPAGANLRFYINPGDWFRFQIGNPSLMPGLHRVPEIRAGKSDRHSLALFYNPAENEKLLIVQELMDLYLNFDHKPEMLMQYSNAQQTTKELAYTEYLESYRGNDFSPIKVKVK